MGEGVPSLGQGRVIGGGMCSRNEISRVMLRGGAGACGGGGGWLLPRGREGNRVGGGVRSRGSTWRHSLCAALRCGVGQKTRLEGVNFKEGGGKRAERQAD